MGSEDLTLRLQPRGKPLPNLPGEITVSAAASIDDIYAAVAKKTNYPIHRLRITRSDSSHLQPSATTTVSAANLFDGSSLFIKDLGPQIAWRTVYFIEYLGPLLIHPLTFYLLRPLLYTYLPYPFSPSLPPSTPPTTTQSTLCAMITAHFIKRELETLFVHRFSAATMPAANIVKNSAYYWTLGGAMLAYTLYYPTTVETASYLYYPGIAVWLFAQASNASAHLTLRNLRRPGSRDRGIPTGYGFGMVTCPNYSFEVLGWVCVAVVAGLSVPAFGFALFGAVIQAKWAMDRERRYRKEFGEKYKKKRWVLIPFVV
ncbi:3-oxo-5a-steroid 4- dehydrogenase [Orbilia brochopaga]|uniref:3-oxo-5a-steroid 4- dehydrogenase n=1 Tax=Orbilia brochopaga TaxID=3140254 RepID=A0AAV9UAS3_9PEZI